MKRKILFAIVFSILIFSLKGLVGKPAQAADQAIVMADLDNSTGTIPITVYVVYYHGGTSSSPGPQFGRIKSTTVAVGARASLYSDLDASDVPYYWVSWSTSCSDPPALAAYSGLWGDGIGPGVAAYQTNPLDVHCQTPNSTPYITNTACANVGWTLTGVGENGANIAYFEVYRSTDPLKMGDATTNPDPSTKLPGTVSASSRSVDWGSLADGTYYVRIRAVSPQGVGSWSSIGSFTCSSVVISSASGLSANPSCNGTSTNLADKIVAVNFSWAAASVGSTEQWLDYSVWNNNFAGGTYNAQSVAVGATSFNFPTGFPQGVRFYWRINNKIGGNWYPSVTANFMTPTCPPNAIWPSATPMATPQVGKPCPAGCTAPTHQYSISRPDAWWHMWGSGANGCPSHDEAGYTSGLSSPSFWWCVGDEVYWEVKPADSAGNTFTAIRIWKNDGGYITSPGAVQINWTWQYEVQIHLTGFTYGSANAQSDNRKVTSTSNTTFCNDGSSSCDFKSPFGNLNSGASYDVAFCAPACAVGVYSSSYSFTSGSCTACPTAGPTPSPEPVVITLSGYSDCVDGLNPKVHLAWTSNSGGTGYTVFRDGTVVTAEGLPNPLGGSDRSWDSTVAQPAGPHNWMVRSTGGTFDPNDSNPLSVTTATCTPPPADPSNLVVSSVCNNTTGLPEITFTWQDNSNIEQGFWMDVSHDAFTGPSSTTASPSVWGVKGITRSGAETTATGGTVQFIWRGAPPPPPPPTSNTDGALDSGNANTTGNPLVPDRGVTYYWRVKAYSADRQSNHVYPGGSDLDGNGIPDGSITPPGVAFTTPDCKFDLEVKNEPGNVQVYEPGATANITVRIQNNSLIVNGAETHVASPAIISPNGLGAWTQSNNPNISCPGSGVSPGGANSQGFGLSTLAVGGSTTVTVSFTVPTAPGTYIAYFVAVPTCSPNNDSNWTNNQFQLTYAVSAKSWFRTINGDVGARGKIQQSNTSPPAVQSTAVLAGNPLDTSVSGRWELNNYTKALFPSDGSGIYNYFNSRFRSKATSTVSPPACGISGTPVVMLCTGDMSVGATSMTTAGNWVIFVDGSLTVTGNITVGSTTTLVFIVRNNVTINTSVTRADGVYIVGGTFADYDNAAGKSRNTAPYYLMILGAVYTHAFDLSAFLSNLPYCDPGSPSYVLGTPSCVNQTTYTDFIVFQPKYLVALTQLIGSPSVSWQEVAP